MEGTSGWVGRRRLLQFAGVAGAGLAAGGGVALAAGAGPQRSTGASPAAAQGSPATDWLYLTIVPGTPKHPDWPAFLPADFAIPAHTSIHVQIRCLDDGPAPIPGGYQRVYGTVQGQMRLYAGVDGDPAATAGRSVSAVDPKNVAHTLTFAEPRLSIPIPPLSTVAFAFVSGAPGPYTWQCMAACGTGSGGWGGPMSRSGYMTGTMTVQA